MMTEIDEYDYIIECKAGWFRRGNKLLLNKEGLLVEVVEKLKLGWVQRLRRFFKRDYSFQYKVKMVVEHIEI